MLRPSYPIDPSLCTVGKTGQHMLIECGTDLEGAKQHFTKKYVLLYYIYIYNIICTCIFIRVI